MKITLLITVCILAVLASCKKNSVAPKNTISATIDGVPETFNTNVSAQLGTSVALNSNLIISGASSSAASSDGMAFEINSNSTIDKGSYINNGAAGFMAITYSKGPFSLSNPIVYSTDVNSVYPSNVTITSISNTNVQGTFTGKLLFTDGKTVKTVTDGKFNIDIK